MEHKKMFQTYHVKNNFMTTSKVIPNTLSLQDVIYFDQLKDVKSKSTTLVELYVYVSIFRFDLMLQD